MSKEISIVEQVRTSIQAMAPQFKMALPSHVTPEKFIRVLMTAVQNNKSILEADRTSLYSAAMKAAQSGLLVDGRESTLVKFGNQVQFMSMTAGLMKQMRNSGELLTITAHVVYEKDEFSYYIDSDGEHLKHIPLVFGDRGKVKGTYAMGKTKDGGVYIELMTEEEIQQVRNVSRSKDSGPWQNWTNEMRKKTAIRRLSKRMPMSTDLLDTVHADEEIFESKHQEPEQPQPVSEPVKPKKSKLSQAVEKLEEVEDAKTNQSDAQIPI